MSTIGHAPLRRPASSARQGPPVAGIIGVALVVVVLAALIGAKLLGFGAGPSSQDNQPVPAAVLTAATQVSAVAFDAAGQGANANVPVRLPGPRWMTTDGKPQVLYIGSEYCPYCAGQRWPLIVALSRFGQFSGLALMTSAADDTYPSTPTFTFVHATYASQYLSFSAVELQTNQRQGNGYAPLQQPTAEQKQRLDQYDKPPYTSASAAGSIPFLDVADTFMTSGTMVDPATLHGRDWTAIAQALQQSGSADAQSILGSANVITAQICNVDGRQPADVCGSPSVTRVSLPQ